MCEDVRFQVGWLGKFFVAAVKWTHIWAISSVNTHVCAQVKVQREPFAAALKCALKWKRISWCFSISQARSQIHIAQLTITPTQITRIYTYIYVYVYKDFSTPMTKWNMNRFFLTEREENYLERFLSCVYELMSLQFWTFHKGFATLRTDMHTRPMGMQVFSHRWVVPEHLCASLGEREWEVYGEGERQWSWLMCH